MTAVVDGYASAGVDLPPRRFVSNGETAHDMEQLTVSFLRSYGVPPLGTPASESIEITQCLMWRAAQFEVRLLRCAPVGVARADGTFNPPSVASMEANAEEVMADERLITSCVLDAYRADAFGIGPNLALEDWAWLGPEGGLVGGRLRLRIGLI